MHYLHNHEEKAGSLRPAPLVGGPMAAPSQQGPTPGPQQEAELKGPGFSIRVPLPPWGVACIAALLIAGLALGGYYWLLPRIRGQVMLPQSVYTVYAEAAKHSPETPESQDVQFADGTRVTLKHFHDGCTEAIRRYENRVPDQHWFLDLSKNADTPSPGKITHLSPRATDSKSGDWEERTAVGLNSGMVVAATVWNSSLLDDLVTSPPSAEPETTATLQPVLACTGHCLDPHPGTFQY
jgi:hypothetical protein